MTAPDPTTLAILLSGLGATGSAIAVLFKTLLGHVSRIESRLSDCESDRQQLHADQTELWRQLAKQAGQPVDDLRKTSTRNER